MDTQNLPAPPPQRLGSRGFGTRSGFPPLRERQTACAAFRASVSVSSYQRAIFLWIRSPSSRSHSSHGPQPRLRPSEPCPCFVSSLTTVLGLNWVLGWLGPCHWAITRLGNIIDIHHAISDNSDLIRVQWLSSGGELCNPRSIYWLLSSLKAWRKRFLARVNSCFS